MYLNYVITYKESETTIKQKTIELQVVQDMAEVIKAIKALNAKHYEILSIVLAEEYDLVRDTTKLDMDR